MNSRTEIWFVKENTSIEFSKGKITLNTLTNENNTGKKYKVEIKQIN